MELDRDGMVKSAIGRVEEVGGDEQIGDDDGKLDREVWLAYYRHGFGLGEHYNSLRRVDGGSGAVGLKDDE